MPYTPSRFSEILTHLFQKIWQQDDMDAIPEVFHPEARVHGLIAGQSLSVSEYRDAAEHFQQLAQVVDFEILDILHDGGDKAAVRMRIVVTFLANNRTAPQDTFLFVRLKGSKIIEMHALFDTIKYYEEIGGLPENARLLLLSGHRLT